VRFATHLNVKTLFLSVFFLAHLGWLWRVQGRAITSVITSFSLIFNKFSHKKNSQVFSQEFHTIFTDFVERVLTSFSLVVNAIQMLKCDAPREKGVLFLWSSDPLVITRSCDRSVTRSSKIITLWATYDRPITVSSDRGAWAITVIEWSWWSGDHWITRKKK